MQWGRRKGPTGRTEEGKRKQTTRKAGRKCSVGDFEQSKMEDIIR